MFKLGLFVLHQEENVNHGVSNLGENSGLIRQTHDVVKTKEVKRK